MHSKDEFIYVTQNQMDVLSIVINQFCKLGFVPPANDIAKQCDKTASVVHSVLRKLARKGLIKSRAHGDWVPVINKHIIVWDKGGGFPGLNTPKRTSKTTNERRQKIPSILNGVFKI